MTDLLFALHHEGVPLLTLLWALPALGAAVVARVDRPRHAGSLALAVLALTAALGAALAWGWHTLGVHHGFSFEQRLSVGPLGYHVGLDGLGALFVLLTTLLALLVALYGRQARKVREGPWHAWGLLLTACLLGMFTSLDLLQAGLFGLAEVVPGVALVRGWGTGEQREHAARLFRRSFLAAGALWIAGAVVLAVQVGSFDQVDLLSADVAAPWDGVAFVLLLFAVAVRIPLFPFHAWLPPVIEHGPVVGLNVLLLGVKAGAFLLVRFVLPGLPDVATHWAWAVSGLGILGMIYGALVAFAQPDLRRMVAFAALSHMGFVVPGLFSLTAHGVEGALLESVNLGVASAGLYFVVGFLHLRTGTTQIAHLRGLASGVPLLALTLLVVVLTSVGMPGTTGFDGMHLVLEGSIDDGAYGVAVATGLGSVLAAALLLFLYQRLVFAAPEEGSARLPDLYVREIVIAATLSAAVFGMGLWADPWIEALEDNAEEIAARTGHVHTDEDHDLPAHEPGRAVDHEEAHR